MILIRQVVLTANQGGQMLTLGREFVDIREVIISYFLTMRRLIDIKPVKGSPLQITSKFSYFVFKNKI